MIYDLTASSMLISGYDCNRHINGNGFNWQCKISINSLDKYMILPEKQTNKHITITSYRFSSQQDHIKTLKDLFYMN